MRAQAAAHAQDHSSLRALPSPTLCALPHVQPEHSPQTDTTTPPRVNLAPHARVGYRRLARPQLITPAARKVAGPTHV